MPRKMQNERGTNKQEIINIETKSSTFQEKQSPSKTDQTSTVWRKEQKKQELKVHTELQPQHKTGFNEDKGTDPWLTTWRIITVILGTSCIILVTKVGFLIPNLFSRGEKQSREPSLLDSLYLKNNVFQGTSKFKIQCEKDANKNAVSSMEVIDPSALPPTTGCYKCQGRWLCCGEKCYYFSEEEKTWDESEASCRLLGSHLAKIDSREEQNFIQSRLNYSYWVGLRKKGGQFLWIHQEDEKLSSDLDFHMTTHLADAGCGYIKPKLLNNARCSRLFPYICKKNFTCLLTS